MNDDVQPYCPECAESLTPAGCDRRDFIRALGQGAAALFALGPGVPAFADPVSPKPAARPPRPAESLVRELFATLSTDQKKQLVLPFNHGAGPGRVPSRQRIYNSPLGKPIGDSYTLLQQELIERILRAIAAGEDGYRRLSRNGTFDTGGGMRGCGATFFGEPADGKEFAWVFSGHHLTARCDGNFQDGTAFGGPVFYGHSPHGYSDKNVFFYQTKSVLSVFDALSENQRKQAVVAGNPGEGLGSVKLRGADQPRPGLACAELDRDQHRLIEAVMRDILSPYRKEDADEVMQIVKDNGGLDKVHIAFYQDGRVRDSQRWHFWRLEGPGFVWNYRVLPHVHTYVNVARKV